MVEAERCIENIRLAVYSREIVDANVRENIGRAAFRSQEPSEEGAQLSGYEDPRSVGMSMEVHVPEGLSDRTG
jgi:hypothetical protein